MKLNFTFRLLKKNLKPGVINSFGYVQKLFLYIFFVKIRNILDYWNIIWKYLLKLETSIFHVLQHTPRCCIINCSQIVYFRMLLPLNSLHVTYTACNDVSVALSSCISHAIHNSLLKITFILHSLPNSVTLRRVSKHPRQL